MYNRREWILIVSVAATWACGSHNQNTNSIPRPISDSHGQYQATIRRTSYGIPHVVARDLGGLGFGQGYAFARMHACSFSDQLMRIHGEQARYFGAGVHNANIDSDFGFRALDLPGRARDAWPALDREVQNLYSGYAAGFNHYLNQTGDDGLPPACAGAPWVRPVDGVDVLAHSMHVGIMAVSGRLVGAIGSAQPGQPGGARLMQEQGTLPASNAWGIGATRSATGHGMLVANPHFPWEGSTKLYETHLTVPGDLDVYGAALLGVPLVNIGFTHHHAWSHNVSASRRIALYRLSLAEGDPTKYRYGGEIRSMIATEHTIEIKGEDGALTPVTRTLYRSHQGPIIVAQTLPWTQTFAFALRDVTLGNPTSANQYLAMIRASSLDAFRQAFASYQGTPFVNTTYADRDGNAWFADTSLVPNLSPQAAAAWNMALGAMPPVRQAYDMGTILLDGSQPMFELVDTDGAAHPGVMPFAQAPQITRRDYVVNANNSYRLANPSAPLDDHSPFFGPVRTPISARARMNLMMLTETGASGASGADGKFSLDELESAILSNRVSTAEVWRDDVVARCRTAADLAGICDVLAKWNARLDLDSVGALMWREFLGSFPGAGSIDKTLAAEPFDPTRPVETPRGLAPTGTGPDPIITALRSARDRLQAAGIDPLTTPLGQAQYTEKEGQRLPVHGGNRLEGTTNLAIYAPEPVSPTSPGMRIGEIVNGATGLSTEGYPINYGSSFLLLVAYTSDAPVARGIMTYSASSDPRSPHFDDQSELYRRKQMRPVSFLQRDIEADPSFTMEEITAQPDDRPRPQDATHHR